MRYQLIWVIAGLAALSGVLWGLLTESRSRVKYTWLLLCISFLFLWLPARAPWMDHVAIALAELAALHLFTIVVFRVVLRRFDLPMIISDVAVMAGYAVVLVSLLVELGVHNIGGLIATSAVLTAIIGFAFQELLLNLIGGLSIQADGAIRTGAWIKCEHAAGQVLRVRLRYTSIQTAEGDVVLIPNHALTKAPVTIIGERRRTLVRFRLGSQHRPTHIIKVVDDALASSPIDGIAADPQPRCFVMEHQMQHIEYGVHVWVISAGQNEQSISQVLTRIYFALRRANAPVASIATTVELQKDTPAPDQQQELALAGAAFKKSPIGRSLTEDEVKLVAHRLKRSWFAPGEAIVKQGEAGESMFVILHGSVSVMLAADSGAPQQIATLESGSFFGEMSLLTGDTRTTSVIAIDNVECAELDKEHLEDIMLRRPELAREISTTLDERQLALASAREKMRRDSELPKEVDFLSRIQQFFGITKKQ